MSRTQSLLLSTGVVTAVPLLLFTSAARRLPLSTLGFLQYLAPIGQFVLAVVAFGEAFERDRLAAAPEPHEELASRRWVRKTVVDCDRVVATSWRMADDAVRGIATATGHRPRAAAWSWGSAARASYADGRE